LPAQRGPQRAKQNGGHSTRRAAGGSNGLYRGLKSAKIDKAARTSPPQNYVPPKPQAGLFDDGPDADDEDGI